MMIRRGLIAAWVVFLLIIVAAAYYIFFAAPELVVIPPSGGGLDAIAPIATLSVHPQTVVQSPEFQSLQSTITPPTPQGPAGVGRPNPFIAP